MVHCIHRYIHQQWLSIAAIVILIFFCRYLHLKKTDSSNGELCTKAHTYDEVENYAKFITICKSQHIYSKDDVIFEASTSRMPAYQSLTKSLDDECNNKTRNEKSHNDYYIDGEGNSKFKNLYSDGKYFKAEKELQNDHQYNKLIHLKQ